MFSLFLRFFFLLSVPLWPFGTGRPDAPVKKTALELVKYESEPLVRISILPDASEIKVSSAGTFQVLDERSHVLFSGNKLPETKVTGRKEDFQFGKQAFGVRELWVRGGAEGIKVNGRLYRYAVKMDRAGGRVSAVNEIPIEDYLKGVLPAEVNPRWPFEALKAQAVAARTYALFKSLENKDEKFDLSKDVLSQVYAGKGVENDITSRAVEMTRGQIMTYRGKIFPAYFHSTCGGQTTRAEYLWDVEPSPALKGTKCTFCVSSKHYRWTAEIPAREIEEKLKKRGVKAPGIKNLEIDDKDETGRAKSFLITFSGGQVRIHSNDFRLWVDPGKFKSTWIESLTKTSRGFVFQGRGWGHGVGLCQYGMKQLAEFGYSYDRILKYYYLDVELSRY